MLTHGCIRFPVYAADISPRIQFQEQNNDAALRNMSNGRSRHHNFSAEELQELSHHPFALLAGRVFRVTFRGTLLSPDHRFQFSAQHLYALLKICLISIGFPSWILIFFNSMAVRNEMPFAYLLQHDQCADTSLLKHEGSVVLQVWKPYFAAWSQPSHWIHLVIVHLRHASLFSFHIVTN